MKNTSESDSAANARERLLDVAGTLFARHGLDGLSVRQITAAADVNLAAINYHFGSKEGLFHAVCLRKIQISNRRKLDLLDALEKNKTPTVEEILDAFVRPAVLLLRAPDAANLLMSRIIMNETKKPQSAFVKLFRDEIRPISARFVAALARALPEVSEENLMWGLVFHTGIMLHTTTGADKTALIYPTLQFSKNPEDLIARMVKFVAAGLRALAK